MLFPDDASVGGGGGLYYNGSPRHKSYTCAACHIGAPGHATLEVTSEPPQLMAEGHYEPEQVYLITVRLAGETRGFDSVVNYNTFSVEVLDASDQPTGSYQNFATGGMVATLPLDALFARARDDIAATEWSFEWVAPSPNAGSVEFYFAGVDGDGAESADSIATDPLGDDVVVVRLAAHEAGNPPPASERGAGCEVGPVNGRRWPAAALFGLALVLFALWIRRRRYAYRNPG